MQGVILNEKSALNINASPVPYFTLVKGSF